MKWRRDPGPSAVARPVNKAPERRAVIATPERSDGGTEVECLRRVTHYRARDRSRTAETLGGSVHESLVRHLPNEKPGRLSFRDLVSARQRFEPNLELPPLRIPAMCYRP